MAAPIKSPRRSPRFWICLSLYTAVAIALGWFLGTQTATPAVPSPNTVSRALSGTSAKSPSSAPPLALTSAAASSRVTDSESEDLLRSAATHPGTLNPLLRAKLWQALFETDESVRAARFQSLLAFMRPEDAPLVEQLFYDADKDGRGYLNQWTAFFAAWGKVDGPAAMQQLQNSERLRHFPGLFTEAARGWARTSPDSALQWLASHENDPDTLHSSSLKDGIWQGVMQQNPAAAVDLVTKSFPAPEAARRLGSLASMVVYAGGLDAGQRWLAEQSARTDLDPSLLRNATQQIAEASTRGGPERLAQFIASRPDSAEWQKQAASLVSGWVPASNPMRLDYIAALPETCYDSAAINRALSEFQNVPDVLGRWLTQNPNVRFYDDAALVYARSLQSVDPAAAQKWANTIHDPAKRATFAAPSPSVAP